jgi:hypothetical protein
MNENVAAVPGMPWIEKFAAIGTVGLTLSSCTTPGARTWRWVPVFPIRRSPISTTHIQIRAIAGENRMPSMPIRSLAGCITNTSSRSPARDSIFADHNPHLAAGLLHALSRYVFFGISFGLGAAAGGLLGAYTLQKITRNAHERSLYLAGWLALAEFPFYVGALL